MKTSSTLQILLLLPVLGTMLPLPAQAQITGAQVNGTLFTTPEERTYLDYLRQEFLARNREAGFDIEEQQIPAIPASTGPQESRPVQFAFGGIMTSRDGNRTIWLNNQSLQESELPDNISLVAEGQRLSLRVASEGTSYLLRPGQTLNLSTGEIIEAYQRPQALPEVPPAASIQAPEAVPATAPQQEAAQGDTEPPAPLQTPQTGEATTDATP